VDQASDEQCAPRTQAEQRAAGGNRASRSLHQAAYQRHDDDGSDQIIIGDVVNLPSRPEQPT